MNCQVMKNQTSTLHCKPHSFHVLTESKAIFSVTLIGDSSKLLWYIRLTFKGLALNARFFQENQNSKHSPHIWKPQSHEELLLCGRLCWSPTPCPVSREGGSELFQSCHCLDRGWGLPSWPALPLDHPSCVPRAVRASDPSRQTLAGQEIVGAG